MLNYVFILHFYIFLLDWKKCFSDFFAVVKKGFLLLNANMRDGKREKRRSSFLLRKEAFSQTIALKICLLSCPCKFITSRVNCPLDAGDSHGCLWTPQMSARPRNSQNLFSLANNGTKAWTVIKQLISVNDRKFNHSKSPVMTKLKKWCLLWRTSEVL